MLLEGPAMVRNVRLAWGASQVPPRPHPILSFSPRIVPGTSRYSIYLLDEFIDCFRSRTGEVRYG